MMANKREGFKRVSIVLSWVLCAPPFGFGLLWLFAFVFADDGREEDYLLWSAGFFLGALFAIIAPRIIYRVGVYLADGFKEE